MNDFKQQAIGFVYNVHVESPAKSKSSLEMLANMHPLDGLMSKLGADHPLRSAVEKLADLRRIPARVEAAFAQPAPIAPVAGNQTRISAPAPGN